MAPTTSLALSPAELSYLYTSLSSSPPIRPDGRPPTQFRRLIAETDILPATNGSARICFADGTEAVVGIKANVEKTPRRHVPENADTFHGDDDVERGCAEWVRINIEIPDQATDDALPVFLANMITEALTANDTLVNRLIINSRFHWGLYIDILLLSPPLSYPLPLLSLTTHLALLQTRLPAVISDTEDDPIFDDDWDAAVRLYPADMQIRPPITLLVMSAGSNVIFDATRQELAVADHVLAVSVAVQTSADTKSVESETDHKTKDLQVVAIRAVDPPSRLTNPGIPDSMNPITGGTAPANRLEASIMRETDDKSVWRPPRGGVSRKMIDQMVKLVTMRGGVGHEVLDALRQFET